MTIEIYLIVLQFGMGTQPLYGSKRRFKIAYNIQAFIDYNL